MSKIILNYENTAHRDIITGDYLSGEDNYIRRHKLAQRIKMKVEFSIMIGLGLLASALFIFLINFTSGIKL